MFTSRRRASTVSTLLSSRRYKPETQKSHLWPENQFVMDHFQSDDQSLLGSLLSSYSRARRLEDRIRSLCAQAVTTTDPAELNPILEELTSCLRKQLARVRQIASTRPLPRERRQLQPW